MQPAFYIAIWARRPRRSPPPPPAPPPYELRDSLNDELLKADSAITNLRDMLLQWNGTENDSADGQGTVVALRSRASAILQNFTDSVGTDPVDRLRRAYEALQELHLVAKGINPLQADIFSAMEILASFGHAAAAVSYTHLTLPTICSV